MVTKSGNVIPNLLNVGTTCMARGQGTGVIHAAQGAGHAADRQGDASEQTETSSLVHILFAVSHALYTYSIIVVCCIFKYTTSCIVYIQYHSSVLHIQIYNRTAGSLQGCKGICVSQRLMSTCTYYRIALYFRGPKISRFEHA